MPEIRTVICRKYGKKLPGLSIPPMPGPLGQDIFENVSARAWQEWQTLQTMLINEFHLSLRDPDARNFLNKQRTKFLNNEDWKQPSGYVPPDE